LRCWIPTQITNKIFVFTMSFLVLSQALDSSKFVWTQITGISKWISVRNHVGSKKFNWFKGHVTIRASEFLHNTWWIRFNMHTYVRIWIIKLEETVWFHFSLRYILPALFTCIQILHPLYQFSFQWWSLATVSFLGFNDTFN
jgi:hypothetical protein